MRSETFLQEVNQGKEKQFESTSFLEGVDFVFEQNPEISSIGNKEEYLSYLETIFPNSIIKKIVYHGSDAEFRDEGFKPMKPNFDTLNSFEGVYNFTSDKNFSERYGKKTYAVLLNIERPIIESRSGEYADDMDSPLSESLYKIGKRQDNNPFSVEYNELLKDTDGVINNISGEDYVKNHPVSGREVGIPKQQIISVFKSEQIHILGSKTDQEKFKKFIENQRQ